MAMIEPTLASLCVEKVDRQVDSIEAKENIVYTIEAGANGTKMETMENIGMESPTLSTCGLFNDLDILHSLEATESLDQICPEDISGPLGLFDQLNIKAEPGNLPLESLLDLGESSSSMDNPFFEHFMDLDQLFPDLPLFDTLNLEFEAEQTSQVAAPDICQSDVVSVATRRSGAEYVEVSSPGSKVIDVVSLDEDAEVPLSTDDLSDIALSPESVVDVTSVEEDPASLGSSVHHIILDGDQAEHTSEEITVIQTSDCLTLLTQELMQSSSYASDVLMTPSEERQLFKDSGSLSTMTVDLDELFSFSHSVGLADSLVTPSVDDACSSSESVVSLSENSVKTPSKQKRKSTCSSECSSSPSKKVKCDDARKISNADVLDKQSLRRMKNNVASKHARAARKQKEQELFQQEEELTKSNAELQKQLAELEKLAATMRKVLVEKLSGVTCPV